MADANANPTLSCGDGTMTARGYTVSKQTECECLLDNVAHKNGVLPNGCLKHSLEENGRVKLLENAEQTGITVCEAFSEADDAVDVSSCNEQQDICDCDHLTKCTADNATPTVSTLLCANKPVTGQNGEHIQEHANDAFDDVEAASEGVAKLSIAESECEESEKTEVSHASSSGSKSSVCTDLTATVANSCCRRDIVGDLEYVVYQSELQMPYIMKLITKDLSEPYSIYTYRYFIHNWPRLCFLTMDKGKYVGAIVCKHDLHKKMVRRGYIAMLAVDHNYRRNGVGSHLVMKAIRAMVAEECDEVVLETEITNKAALRLYENLGFLRDKRLFRYYLNGVDALRLKLWLR